MVVGLRPFNLNLVVVPSDSANPVPYTSSKLLTSAIYVGVLGDVTTVAEDESTTLWKAVPAGTFLPVAVKRVAGSGTTATNLIACYWV